MPNKAAWWRAKVAADNGREWPVVERARHGLTFANPDNPRERRLIRSIGPMHTLAGEEIDTDLEDGGDHARTKQGRLDFGAHIRHNGSRLLTPRSDHPAETVELGRCERWQGNNWVPMPAVSPSRNGHQLSFDHGNVGRVRVSVKPSFVAYEIIVGNEKQNSGWRWQVTLSGLTWLQRADSAELVDGSGVTVMYVSAPKWTDAAAKSGPVGWSYSDGYLVHDAAVLPADVVWPVVVR